MKITLKMDVSNWVITQTRRIAAHPLVAPILAELRDILIGRTKTVSVTVGVATVVAVVLFVLISGAVCERLVRLILSDDKAASGGRRTRSKRRGGAAETNSAAADAEEHLPVPGPNDRLPPSGVPGRVFACRLCMQDLHAAALSGLSPDAISNGPALTVASVMARHVDGKRHVKAAADVGAPKRSGVAWIATDEWQALQRKRAKLIEASKTANATAKLSNGDNSGDSSSDSDEGAKASAAQRAGAATASLQRGRKSQGSKQGKRAASCGSDSGGPDADGFVTVGGRGKGKGSRRRGHGHTGDSGSDSDPDSRDRALAAARALAASRGLPGAVGSGRSRPVAVATSSVAVGGAGAATTSVGASAAAAPAAAAAAAAPASRSAADAAWMVSTSRKKGKKGGNAADDGAAGVVGATFVGPRSVPASASSAAGGPAVKAPRVMRSLVHYEGGLNVLEGLELWPKFVSPAQETGLIAAVDASLADGQRGRLRAATYRATRTGADAAVLQFGAAVDAAGALASGGAVRAVEPSRLVDVIPSALLEMPRRIATLGREELTLPRAMRAEDLCVATAYVLEPGMHLPPMRPIADAAAFHEPVLLLALTAPGRDGPSTEQILFGQHIVQSEHAPGSFDAAFALTVKGKSLLCLREPVATDVQIAVPATTGRLILIVFRWPKDELKDQLSSRGNIRL